MLDKELTSERDVGVSLNQLYDLFALNLHLILIISGVDTLGSDFTVT